MCHSLSKLSKVDKFRQIDRIHYNKWDKLTEQYMNYILIQLNNRIYKERRLISKYIQAYILYTVFQYNQHN